ncbi:hypothetical protein Tco_0238343 [Tanacetum coccineum]
MTKSTSSNHYGTTSTNDNIVLPGVTNMLPVGMTISTSSNHYGTTSTNDNIILPGVTNILPVGMTISTSKDYSLRSIRHEVCSDAVWHLMVVLEVKVHSILDGKQRRVQTQRLSLQETTPTQPASQPLTHSPVPVTEKRHANGREMSDDIPAHPICRQTLEFTFVAIVLKFLLQENIKVHFDGNFLSTLRLDTSKHFILHFDSHPSNLIPQNKMATSDKGKFVDDDNQKGKSMMSLDEDKYFKKVTPLAEEIMIGTLMNEKHAKKVAEGLRKIA